MIWSSLDTWIIVIVTLTALSCALPGVFLVLRKNSLLGDGMSHAVLPGIALAFILTGTRNSLVLFLGAAASGILLAFLVELLQRHLRIDKDANLGAVFSVLFAGGLVLMVHGADKVDLDPSCVLFGAVELAPLAIVNIAGIAMPEAFLRLLILFLGNIGLLLLCYKELNLISFDPALAKSLGYKVKLCNYLFTADVAICIVSVFEIAGSIQTVAFLILPAAAAYLVTTRTWHMILCASIFSVIAAIGGYTIAVIIPLNIGLPDTTTSGGITVMSGIILLLTILYAHGLKNSNRRGRNKKVTRMMPLV